MCKTCTIWKYVQIYKHYQTATMEQAYLTYFSLGVSIKMNLLLFSPALLMLLMVRLGTLKTIWHLTICAAPQVQHRILMWTFHCLYYVNMNDKVKYSYQVHNPSKFCHYMYCIYHSNCLILKDELIVHSYTCITLLHKSKFLHLNFKSKVQNNSNS